MASLSVADSPNRGGLGAGLGVRVGCSRERGRKAARAYAAPTQAQPV